MTALLESGFKPKIVAVEYNSAYGPTNEMTIRYQPRFAYTNSGNASLYYGVSIAAWRKLLGRYGYRFVTVDQNGVNAFFIDPSHFESSFIGGLRGEAFRENFVQRDVFRAPWQAQFELLPRGGIVEV
jgi:hypothetical protein